MTAITPYAVALPKLPGDAGRHAMLALAAVAVLLLLAIFGHVVTESVHQGAQRRADALVRSNEVWQCNSMRGKQVRDNCLQVQPVATAAVAPLAAK